ncbi:MULTISPECIES: hypothetical protein [Bacillaceae]|uniref:hypothetical protein n=1 Tax=Bacillaceae TaxID=186817 RepID=UPI001BDE0B04|nr:MULTISPECIES: hypothetical protein [Bacillaceae]MDX8362685.1 hypothetical protein [Cytobacillus sp. IB215316]
MKRLFITFIQIAVLIGCSTNPHDNIDTFRIAESYYAGGGSEDLSTAHFQYFITVYYKEGMNVDINSIEPVLDEWIESKVINKSINNITDNKDGNFIKVVGKVTLDTWGFNKETAPKIERDEKPIQGISFQLDNGEKYKVTGFGESTSVDQLPEEIQE